MNNNYRKIIVNSVNISIGEIGAAYHKYFKITNDNGKVGIVDNKDIVIIPSICDSIGLHYATSCYMTLKGIESYCWFISPVAFFAILDEYNKDDLIKAINDIDESDEWIIQLDIFKSLGIVIISPECISIFQCNENNVANIWPWIKDNVDNSRLLTKENTLKIIRSQDWNSLLSSNNVE